MTSKDIILPDGTKLEWLNKSPKTFLNKSIVLYGLSGTGKTSIILDILYVLRNHISYPFIISKSQASAKRNFEKCIPRGCIKCNLTKEWLEQFIIRQTDRASIYDTVNKLENLKRVFDMIDNSTATIMETQIINDAECHIQRIELDSSLSYAKKTNLVKGVKKARNDALAILYKKFIRAFRVELEAVDRDMSRECRLVVKYLDFMPHALLVFDDCAFMIKQWVKESHSMKDLFYQGRNYYTTILLGTQADKELDPEIRKSAYISIFTTVQDVISAFGKASNSFPDHDRKRAMQCANAVFMPDGVMSTDNFQKMVYVRHDAHNPFRYTIADLREEEEYRIGADCVWELDEILYPRDDDKKSDMRIFDKYMRD
jgi:hypothetical protein